MKAARELRPTKTSIAVVAVFTILAACAPLAEVREVTPTFHAQPTASPQLQKAERAIVEGEKLQRSDPDVAAGFYLAAVEAATRDLRMHPSDPRAEGNYNFALSRVFSVIRDADRDPWIRRWNVPAPDDHQYRLTQRPAANPAWNAKDFELIPADQLDVRGKFIVRRATRAGVGAALVAVRKPQAPSIRRPFVPPRIYLAVTAVARLRGHDCQIEFINPLVSETTTLSGRELTSAADFTAPMALGLSRQRPEKLGVGALLDPEKFADKAGLIQVEPYAPSKIPLLLVHGLQSTPVTWVPMINTLWSDPVIRRNYQIWVFAYPSGYPIPYSAALLRKQLDLLDKTYPDHRRMVMIGHSMGGILSRLMISDSGGDYLWRYFFTTPPAETNLSPAGYSLVKESLIFKPRRDVARVIFISTPHRGSTIAQGPIGRLASTLIHKPLRFVSVSSEIFQRVTIQQQDPAVMKLKRMPTSVDTLSPNDAFVKAMNELQLANGIPYHSIIGDRGRGDTPNSSDGVVPYWSSHLVGAQSENIVPSDHAANQNAQAISEVIRILRQHVASRQSVEEPLTASGRNSFAHTYWRFVQSSTNKN